MDSESSPRPFRIAIVGCGSIAPTHAAAIEAMQERGVTLAAVCDLVAERAEDLAGRFHCPNTSFESVLSDASIDAVSVCTPSGLHADHAVLALEAGKHVIVEKPMDISLAACDRMITAANAAGRQLGVISQHRFDPASQRVAAALRAGELGRLIVVDARIPWYRTQEYYDSGDWRGTWALDGGGCLMNQGIHTADLMRWLCGPVSRIHATMKTAAHERIEVEDLLVATVEFESGALGTLMASTALYPGFPARLALHGTEGTAVIEGDRLLAFEVRGADALQPEAAHSHAIQVAMGGTRSAVANAGNLAAAAGGSQEWGDAHRSQLSEFVDACREGRSPAIDGIEGRKAVEIVISLYASARNAEAIGAVGV